MVAVYQAVVDVDGDGDVEAVVLGVGFAEGDFGDRFVLGEVADMGDGGEFDPGDGGVVDDVGASGVGDHGEAGGFLDSGDFLFAVFGEGGEVFFVRDECHAEGVVRSADGGGGVDLVVYNRATVLYPETELFHPVGGG